MTMNKAGHPWSPKGNKNTKRKNKQKAKKDKRSKRATSDSAYMCQYCSAANKKTSHKEGEICLTKLFKDKNVTDKDLQSQYIRNYLALKKTIKDRKTLEKVFKPMVMCVNVAPPPGDNSINQAVMDVVNPPDAEVSWTEEI